MKLAVTILGIVLGLVVVILLTLRRGLEELGRLSSALSIKFKTDSDRSKFLQSPQQKLQQAEMSKSWIELLWQFEKTFSATNYIKKEDFFDKPYADHGLAVQTVQAMVRGSTIKKILIYDNDAELVRLEPTLQSQYKAGLNVRYLQRNKIDSDRELAAMLSKLDGNIDFGLFDSDIVLLWHLNSDRDVKGGTILFGKEQFTPYYNFFEAIFRAATPWPPPDARNLPVGR